MTRILAGPTATQLLGDLGADVIKVERAGAGDDTRRWGPPFLKGEDGEDTTESAYFLSANRSKRSLTLDLSRPAGVALAKQLIAKCDVLVENFKVGDLAARGLGHEDLRREFPRLVYCSITGFGQDGPYAPRAGYDLAIQAMGGIMSITGDRDGEPAKVGVGVADVMCGMYAVTAILAALRHRDRSGEGQHVDAALLDSQVAWLINAGMNHLIGGEAFVQGRMGTAHPNIVPYQALPASDGYFILAVGNDGQFRKFCDLAGLADLPDDARFATNAARVGNREALIPLLREATAKRPAKFWLDGLAPLAVPAAPVNDIPEVFDDPQVQYRGMRIDLPHPLAGGGTVPLIASPVRLSATPVEYRHAPPTLGQHTDEILRDLAGMDADEIARLRDDGII